LQVLGEVPNAPLGWAMWYVQLHRMYPTAGLWSAVPDATIAPDDAVDSMK